MNRGSRQESPSSRDVLIDFDITFPIDIKVIQNNFIGNMELYVQILSNFETVTLDTIMRSMAKQAVKRDLDGMK